MEGRRQIMANHENTTVAPGVTRTDCHWGYYLQGTRVDLLRAGLAKESWFPTGQRDKGGRGIRMVHTEIGNGSVLCLEAANGRCYVAIEPTREKREREQFEEAMAEANRKIEQLPIDADAFLKDTAERTEILVGECYEIFDCSKYNGYRLHADTLAEVERIGRHLVMAIENGKAIFNSADRAAAERKIRAEIAEHDPAAQRFMHAIKAQAERNAKA